MSIFGNIMSSVFGKAKADEAAPGKIASGAEPAASGATPGAGGMLSEVDVAGILNKLAAEKNERLDWQRSIVDLMKLLDLDCSLSARKDLAKELHYSGDMTDSATMNIWLHKQVMKKFAENGGKVPEELKA
jgi:hypothetical protein